MVRSSLSVKNNPIGSAQAVTSSNYEDAPFPLVPSKGKAASQFHSGPVHSLTEPTCSGVAVTRKAGKHLMLLRLFDHGLEASEVCSGFESDLLGKITREVERI